MVLNAAVQALKQAEELKQKVIAENNNPSNPNKTLCLAQLQKAYQNLLLMDLDFALDRKVEQDLWNYGFKNQIEHLQNSAKDKKNSRRAESQTFLSWVLQSATGFYICLLHQICSAFKIELSFRCDIPYIEDDNIQFPVKIPQISSCWYVIQHCLVHLGDLARYNRQTHRADSFYKQALNVSPRNGQPYNQLGLLRAARGDRLSAAYYHARGIAVGGPFPPAVNNLARTLASASTHNTVIKKKCKSPDFDNVGLFRTTRLNSQSYINNYIIVHHQLQSGGELIDTSDSISELNSTLIALVATDEFTSDTLIKMCCLDLFALYSITEGYKIDNSSLSEDERKTYSLLLKLVAGSLAALLLPAHTRDPQELITYSALPAIKIILEWIRLQPNILKHQAFISRPQIWPGLCTLLNNLQESIKDFSGEEYNILPLPEDEDLQGFLPIDSAFKDLKFKTNSSCKEISTKKDAENEENLTPEEINLKMANVLQEHFVLKKKSWNFSTVNSETGLKKGQHFFNNLRAYRLTNLGEWLSSHLKENGSDCFSFSVDEEKELKIFTPIQNSLENPDVLKTIKELSLLREKRLNETSVQSNISIQEDDGDMSDSDNKNEISKDIIEDEGPNEEIVPPPIIISEADFKEKVFEKRAGILKPQGSLEKARGEKALSRSCRIDVISPEPTKTTSDSIIDSSDIQETGSSSSTVSQDGTICSDIGSLLDPPILAEKINNKKEGKKVRTNVAMQAIMKKQEESSKQVKFLTPATTPDSVTESFDISPVENKSQVEKKKIIQPKVLKSLNYLPTDRKTGGILSLKDKSAGYPHLVNTDVTTTAENEKADNQENATGTKSETLPKAVSADKPIPKDISIDVQKQKVSPNHKSKNFDSRKHQDNQENTNAMFKHSYTPWSDANPSKNIIHDPKVFPTVDNWKLDNNFLNVNQNNAGCYSYFPTQSNQKPPMSGISLPVVNPKEIDVRSASMQRQRNSQMPFENNPSKQNYYPNMQYDSNPYNCWNSFENNPTYKKSDENLKKMPNLPPRLANSYVYNNLSNIPTDNMVMNDGQNQSPNRSWWKATENKPMYDNYFPPAPTSLPNFQPNTQQIIHNPNKFNYPSSGHKLNPNQNFNNPQTYKRFNENPPLNQAPNPNMFQPPSLPYGNPPPGINFNPYHQPNCNPGMYSQYNNNLGMPHNLQTPIGSEFLRNNPEAYRITQNTNSGNVSFASDIQKSSAPAKETTNLMHNFNADIPEFVPKQKAPGAGERGVSAESGISGNTNMYSLFSGPESPWQTKNPKTPNDNVSQQTLWLGSGPSPLERLVEQQKQFKYPPADT